MSPDITTDFVHLQVQSAFSFLWGAFTPEDLVRTASGLGQRAVALTDDGLHGAIRFYRAARAADIQPILGARVPLDDGYPLTLLARNRNGYANLCRLLSIAFSGSLLPRPRVGLAEVERLSQGLICLAGGWGSRPERLIRTGQDGQARTWLERLTGIFGPRLFLAVDNHLLDGPTAQGRSDAEVLARSLDLAGQLGLEPVATNSAAFLDRAGYGIHRTLVGIQQEHHHRFVEPLPSDAFFLASGRRMARQIPLPAALANTVRIAEMCAAFSLPVGRLHPPSIIEPGLADRRLAALCLRELAAKQRPVDGRGRFRPGLEPLPPEYLHRLDRELAAISATRLADYFLLVRELIDYARQAGVRHSARGSAAGSLVVHLLLGGVDPVAHDLLFERFINDGRSDMPDIDFDFDSERRDEVIHHLMDRFPDQTAMVATVISFKARSAIRMAARSMGYPLARIRVLARCLPWSLRGRDLVGALEKLPELKDSPLQAEPDLVRLADGLMGLPAASSVHLGGVILAPDHIQAWTPVGRSPKGFPVGQLDKHDVEALGLLKLDMLGLRMHTAVRKAVRVLAEQGVDLDIDRLPLDDEPTFRLLRSTGSLGVFQVESPGQRNLLGRLRPRVFHDLICEISLFRPGPVEGDMVDVFIRRRNAEEPVELIHPDLEPLLGETYGVILFQEQVLKVVHAFAGLPYAEANAFRRAMTKNRASLLMDGLRSRFMAGAGAKGYPRAVARKVFEGVAAFASYGFCKAHAASFAHITYHSAYLKAHHPQAFYLGLLNAGHVGSYPAWVILNEARRRGIPVLPPHVNHSGADYTAEGRGIRVPLTVINGIGPAITRQITIRRAAQGPFLSRDDFLSRVPLSRRAVGKLLQAGALENLAAWSPVPMPEVRLA